MNYSFHPLARQELIDAIDYYNECQDKLGLIFTEEVYKAIQLDLIFLHGMHRWFLRYAPNKYEVISAKITKVN